MSNNSELVDQFVDITKDTEDRAKFFLEANNWTLELALTQYYMSENEDGGRRVPPPELIDVDEGDEDDSDEDYMPAEQEPEERPRRSTRRKKEKPTSSSNVVTLDSMVDSDSDEEEEQGQAFYAGGSERSGQQVLGPPKKNPIKDYVSEIFRSAQESGAEVVDPHSRHAAHAGTSRGGGGGGSMYGGSGYRLGMTDNDHTVLAAPSAPQSHSHARPLPEVIIIKLWSNGLSINDGPLRPYDEPENQSFLNSIKKGEIPAELRKHGNAPVHVDLEDHRKEEFKAPKRKVAMFSGEGHTLGNPAPNVVSSNPSSTATSPTAAAAAPVAAAAPDENATNEKKASEAVQVDAEQPNTMIQIRLADGSRLAARFNHTHTVEDIRRFITIARPTYATRPFNLLTTFPSKELSDGSVSVKDAGLMNAALLQRLK